MGVFHVFQIVQMVISCAKRLTVTVTGLGQHPIMAYTVYKKKLPKVMAYFYFLFYFAFFLFFKGDEGSFFIFFC